MYTEDDKYYKSSYTNKSFDLESENIYADYYDNDIKENKKENYKYHDSYSYNNDIDTSYDEDSDDLEETITVDSVNKKKYGVIIIFLVIVLCILLVVLYNSLFVNKSDTLDDINISFFQNSVEIFTGNSQKLELTMNQTGTNYSIQWYSSDENIARIDQLGNVTGIKEGKVNIIAIYIENGVVKSESQCEVNVIGQS